MEEEKVLYVAVAETLSYDGALVCGSTKHYLITVDSEPVFAMSFRSNKEYGFIKEFKGEVEKHSTLLEQQETPYYRKHRIIYIAKEPFKVWVVHRGWTGDMCDNFQKIIEAQPVKTSELHSFLKQFNP
ncbi:MAG: hypothetical protein QXG39_08565 [Candidatus Aenigmatarchaeota archaeon]